MQAQSRFVLGPRLLVGLFWLVVFAAGAATADRVSGRLSQDFATLRPATRSTRRSCIPTALVRRVRVSMITLAVTPVKPRVIRRGSDLWTPKIV
ncbi:MAG TPA: hypothetical protein VGQ26_00890, partial [Streptosporangiaceae bacterium]|nr:hypothetical protein [Streptosporangiaceae bacterium]